ncbi:MAG: hypothetical protein RLN83_00575 [Balneola sp.]
MKKTIPFILLVLNINAYGQEFHLSDSVQVTQDDVITMYENPFNKLVLLPLDKLYVTLSTKIEHLESSSFIGHNQQFGYTVNKEGDRALPINTYRKGDESSVCMFFIVESSPRILQLKCKDESETYQWVIINKGSDE